MPNGDDAAPCDPATPDCKAIEKVVLARKLIERYRPAAQVMIILVA